MKNTKKIIFAVASGSGGHIIPALVAAQQYHQKDPTTTIILCTGSTQLDKQIAESFPCIQKIEYLHLAKFNPRSFKSYIKTCVQLSKVFFQSVKLIFHYRPHIIINTGGLLAFPLAYIGKLSGASIETYELNVQPGKAVKSILPISTVIHTPFIETQKNCSLFGKNFGHKCKKCNYPLRFTQHHQAISQETARNHLNTLQPHHAARLTPTRKTIFLMGGSQGSQLLNQTLCTYIQKTITPEQQASIQIIHQTGPDASYDWHTLYAQHNIPAITFQYYDHIEYAYALADVIITRAGAGSLFEILFFNKPAIVIPLASSTTHHQYDNAHKKKKNHPELITVIDQQTIKKNHTLFADTLHSRLFHPL